MPLFPVTNMHRIDELFPTLAKVDNEPEFVKLDKVSHLASPFHNPYKLAARKERLLGAPLALCTDSTTGPDHSHHILSLRRFA